MVHAIFAGEPSHGQWLTECRPHAEMDFLQTAEGKEVGERLWRELMARIEKISPEVASYVA